MATPEIRRQEIVTTDNETLITLVFGRVPPIRWDDDPLLDEEGDFDAERP